MSLAAASSPVVSPKVPYPLNSQIELYDTIRSQARNATTHQRLTRELVAFTQLAPELKRLYDSRDWSERVKARFHKGDFDRDVTGFTFDEPTQSVQLQLTGRAPAELSNFGPGREKCAWRLSYEMQALERLRESRQADLLAIEALQSSHLLGQQDSFWVRMQRDCARDLIQGVLSQFSDSDPKRVEDAVGARSLEAIKELATHTLQSLAANTIVCGGLEEGAPGWRWFAIALYRKAKAESSAGLPEAGLPEAGLPEAGESGAAENRELHLFFERVPKAPFSSCHSWHHQSPTVSPPQMLLNPELNLTQGLSALNRNLLSDYLPA